MGQSGFCIRGMALITAMVLVFVLGVQRGGCATHDLETVILQLDWKHNAEFVGFYAAKDQGFYREVGLDVRFVEPGPHTDPVREVVAGRADYGLGQSDLVLGAMKGRPIVLLSNFLKRSSVFVVARPEIEQVSDLAGKAVMGDPAMGKVAELAHMFKAGKLDPGTLNWVPSTFDVDGFARGKADAMVLHVTDRPFVGTPGRRYSVFTPSDFGADFLGQSLFTSKESLADHSDRARRFVEASCRGWAFAMDQDEAVTAALVAAHVPKKSLETLILGVRAVKKRVLPATYDLGTMDRSSLQRIADTFVSLGMADSDYDLSGFIFDPSGGMTPLTQVSLTGLERRFLADHPVVTVAFEDNSKPFSFVADQGHQGFAHDYYGLLAKKTGLQFSSEFGSWTANLDRFKAGKVDLIDGISFDRDRQSFTLFSPPYYTIPLTLFTRNEFGFYFNISQLFGRRVGIVRDVYFKEALAGYPEINIVALADTQALMQGLSEGLVDAVIINLGDGLSTIRKLNLTNVRSAGAIALEGKTKEDLRIGVRVNLPVLLTIVKKGMAAVTASELASLRDKWLLPAPGSTGLRIHLTDSEKDFLVNHQVIRVGNEENWPPFDLNVDGEARGFGVDLLKLVADRIGIHLEFVPDHTWDETVTLFYDKKIDVLHSLTRNQEREKHALFSLPFYSSPHVLMCRKDAPPVTDIRSLYGKTLAMPEKWAVVDYLRLHHPEIKLIYTADTMEALSEVSQGRAFGTIEQEAVLHYFMKKYGFSSLKKAFTFDEFDNLGNASMYIAVRNDWPQLMDLMDKALKTVSPGEMAGLEVKWFGQAKQNHWNRGGTLELSGGEEAFLKNLKKIRFSIHSDAMPFEGDEGGAPAGMVADFIPLFEKKLGVPFQYVPTAANASAVDTLKSGRCDLLPMVAVSHLVDENLGLTEPYLSLSVGIIVNESFPFIKGLGDLAGKDVGIVRDSDLGPALVAGFPLVEFKTVGSVGRGLLEVSSGKLSALVVDLPVASNYIEKLGLSNLKVVGHLDRLKSIGMATQQKSVELNRIMRKLVDSLTREEVDGIYQKWVTLRFEHRFNYKNMWRYLFITALLFSGILFWNRKLSAFNRQMAEANAKLEQLSVTDRLTGLYNRMKIDDTLLEEIGRVLRYNYPLSLILMDIDLFKQVNDTHGHQAGDAVLIQMAKTMDKNIRSTDICGRWGGEEFMVICPHTDLKGALSLAEHLRESIARQIFPHVITQTGSFGVAQYGNGDSEADLIARADRAMYLAKEGGRNRVESVL
ncbi:sensory box histidine kinase (GGDEF domain protein) [Desulforapulum autotrophicum HRM2]|uniref:diguanylate cyclase n=1 Tax=Desulforapulum autotrophicum (strain ATCC 43914 / DSM 3382 / VKM B-1955 / HRM2) TaxID=177437 RepID=C0QC96_DESAH|nr:transporter substrate-binding domain-containing protein [Desulforapulum autotrophicum]ACN17113.1 sensory box histidine kinase (GGDEF domain protein) [Desulforapulum autotrophicum HRM2]